MSKVVILQGWYQNIDSSWYSWLKGELEKLSYEVFLPDLPTIHTDQPDMNLQLKFINDHFIIDENTIVVGHSLGCLLAMRLAEKKKYKKIILVAGWDFDDLVEGQKSFWPDKIDHDKIKKNVKEIYCISSDNDPYHTAIQVMEMSKRLNGKFILVKQAGHFTSEDGFNKMPLVLELINKK